MEGIVYYSIAEMGTTMVQSAYAALHMYLFLSRYGQVVVAVDYSSPTSVKVTTQSGITYSAPYVISTMPLGVMQVKHVEWLCWLHRQGQHISLGFSFVIAMQRNTIQWTPALPADKTQVNADPGIEQEALDLLQSLRCKMADRP